MSEDKSNGYEAIAEDFIAVRSKNGRKFIQNWASQFAKGATLLDVGAGNGEPLTAALIEKGLRVSAIDASPAMVKAFQERFPDIEIACEMAETSDFFDRTFDGILAVGLIFLLPIESQHALIHRMAAALKPKGRLLFSAPYQICTWEDVMTGQPSSSLGAGAYKRILEHCGLHLIGEHVDEGETWYYEAQKP